MNLKTSQDENRSDFVHFYILGSLRKLVDLDVFFLREFELSLWSRGQAVMIQNWLKDG